MEKWGRGEGEGKEKYGHCTNPLPVKHLITIQDGGIENLIYLAFRAKITPALQATLLRKDRAQRNPKYFTIMTYVFSLKSRASYSSGCFAW